MGSCEWAGSARRHVRQVTLEWTLMRIKGAGGPRNRLKASITSNKTLVPQTQCVSIFKHRREGRGWQNRFDSQFTCNISDSYTLGSCWAVLPGSEAGVGLSPVCDSRVGQGQTCAPYRSESDRVSVSANLRSTAAKQQLSVSIKAFAPCVLIGHDSTAPIAIKMAILQKGWAGGWWSVSWRYRFCCFPPALLLRMERGASVFFCPFFFVFLTLIVSHLRLHWQTQQLCAILKD